MWKIFRLALAGILAFIHFLYMIKDDYFKGVHDSGPFYIIMETDFWWIGALYFFSFLMVYFMVLTTDNSDFGWRSISFYTIGHIIMTLIAISICSSSEVNGVIENGIVGIVLSFLSMLMLRGISIGSLLDGGVNHVKNVMHKANDKRYRADLEDIAKQSPEARKDIEKHIDKMSNLEKDAKEAMALIDKY